MRTLLPLLIVVPACGPGASCDGELTQVGVVSELRFARATDGVSRGFDLDGLQSAEDGPDGCGIGDYTTPEGQGGVDNALARLIPALELTEAVAAEDLILAMINAGELLLVWEVAGLDGPVVGPEAIADDDCVTFSLLRGDGAPLVGTHGRLVSGQTFAVDPQVQPSVSEAVLADRSIEAADLDLHLPLEFFDAQLDTTIEHASIHLDLADDGTFTGYLGGALDFGAVIEMARDTNIDKALVEAMPLLFGANADLQPDETGTCTRMSVTFEVAGEQAFLFEG